MSPTRRDFVKTAGVVSAGLALGGSGACGGGAEESESAGGASTTDSKSILILGGTGFIGPHTVQHAVDRGHQVSIFTRGRRENKPSLMTRPTR